MQMAYTGFRLSNEQLSRAQKLAQQLGVSRNKLIGLLIDTAEIKAQPVIEVSLKNGKSMIATVEGADHALSGSL